MSLVGQFCPIVVIGTNAPLFDVNVMLLISYTLKPMSSGLSLFNFPAVLTTQVARKVGASQPQRVKFSWQTFHFMSTRAVCWFPGRLERWTRAGEGLSSLQECRGVWGGGGSTLVNLSYFS